MTSIVKASPPQGRWLRVVICAASVAGCCAGRKGVPTLLERAKKPQRLIRKAASAVIVIAVLKKLENLLGRKLSPIPGSLAGMILLSVVLIALDKSGSGAGKKIAQKVTSIADSASAVLSKWMPLFFAPPLVSLPLAVRSISPKDAPLALAVHVSLYFATCASTAYVVQLVKGSKSRAPSSSDQAPVEAPSTQAAVARAPRPYEEIFVTSLATAIFSLLSLFSKNKRVEQALLVSVTAWTYVLGSSSEKFKAAIHPVVVCGALTCAISAVLGGGDRGLTSYSSGPGALYMQFLGTSLFALGFKMYKTRKVLLGNLLPVTVGSIWATVFSLYGTAIVTRLLKVNKTLSNAFLARSLTTPLAVAVSRILGSDVSLTVGGVVLSGILGANFGKKFLRALGVQKSDFATRGVAMGASAHGLGTAALAVDEPEASSTAAVTFAMTGALSTILVSILPAKRLLLRISSGTAS